MSDYANFQWPSYRPPLETYKLDYGIGVIGYGGIVRAQHMPAYRHAGYRVVAAADNQTERQELARLDGVPNVYADYRKLLERDDVQIVDIAVFHSPADIQSRIQMLKDAVQARKAVFMQKPMATDLKTAEEMVRIAEESGVPFAINQNMRFDPVIYTAKQLLSPERFGKPAFMQVYNTSIEGLNFGFKSEGSPFGPAWQIHAADSIRWLSGGEPVSVYCTNRNNGSMWQIEFSSGAVCDYFEYHAVETFRSETPLRIWAEKGAMRGNHRWNPGSRWVKDFLEVRGYDWPEQIDYLSLKLPDDLTPRDFFIKPNFDHCSSIGGFIGSMGEFMQSLHEKRPALTSAQDNLRSLRLYFAAQLAAENKRPYNPQTMAAV
jgi:predicted dehydrogenase